MKLPLPGPRPGPGIDEDSLVEDPLQHLPTPPTPPRLSHHQPALCSQLRRRKLFAQPQLQSPMRTFPPQISPLRSLGVLRTGSEPLNCFACHLVTVATPSAPGGPIGACGLFRAFPKVETRTWPGMGKGWARLLFLAPPRPLRAHFASPVRARWAGRPSRPAGLGAPTPG